MRNVATAVRQDNIFYKLSTLLKYSVAWFDLPEYNDERDEYIQTGIRPCIVVSNNDCNRSRGDVITVIPITSSTTKVPLPTHYYIDTVEAKKIGLKKASTVLAEGITSISKRRMIGNIGQITNPDVQKRIDEVVLVQLGLAYLLEGYL